MKHPEPERAPDPGFVLLPCGDISDNPLNARRRQDPVRMAGLMETIKAHGVLQPIIVRPIDVPEMEPYQVVAGERRLMASKKLGRPTIPAIVRALTDVEALALQLTENDQREDVHPLDQAEGYERMQHLLRASGQGASVEDLSAHLGHPPAFMRARLRLLALVPQARSAFYDGKLTLGTALLIARMPAADQPKATHELITGDNGQPMSYREAQAHIERTYMLQLARAPWPLSDPTLVPDAGSCMACPKRTGANTELFSDIAQADMCTDSACFAGKRMAYRERQLALAREHNIQVLPAFDARQYVRLDQPFANAAESDKPLRDVIGDIHPGMALVEDRKTKDYHEVVPVHYVLNTLQQRGALRPGVKHWAEPDSAAAPPADGSNSGAAADAAGAERAPAVKTAEPKKTKKEGADRATRIRDAARFITLAAVWAHVDTRREERLPLPVLRMLAEDLIQETDADMGAVNSVCKLGWTWLELPYGQHQVRAALVAMEPDALARLAMMLLISDRTRPARPIEVANHYGIDTQEHERLAAKDVDRLIAAESDQASTPEEALAKGVKRARKAKEGA